MMVPTDASALLAHFRATAAGRYFYEPASLAARLKAIEAASPGAFASLLSEADHAVNWEFPASTAGPAAYLAVPRDYDWARNLSATDPQFPYAMNRHGFWDSLGHAYALTGEDRYAQAWGEQFDAWDAACPPARFPGAAPFWSLLEAANRAASWTSTYFALLDAPAMTAARHARVLARLQEHGDQLAALPVASDHAWWNGHTTNYDGLMHLACCFPELEGAAGWKETARAGLSAALLAQCLPDGGQIERSPSYHAGCLFSFGRPLRLGEAHGVEFGEEYRRRLQGMVRFSDVLRQPDGCDPVLGDSDHNSWSLTCRPWCLAEYDPFQGVGMPEPHPLPPLLAGEGVGGEGEREKVALFPVTGYAVLRLPQVAGGLHLVLDAGPSGGWHGHRDLLGLEIFALGRRLVLDPGRWLYDESDERNGSSRRPRTRRLASTGLATGRSRSTISRRRSSRSRSRSRAGSSCEAGIAATTTCRARPG
jgi:hypothetical protein